MADSVPHLLPGRSNSETQASEVLDDKRLRQSTTVAQSPSEDSEIGDSHGEAETFNDFSEKPRESASRVPRPERHRGSASMQPQCSDTTTEAPRPEPPQSKHEGPSVDANGRYIRRRRASSTFSQKRRSMIGSAPPPLTGAKRDNSLPRLNTRKPNTVNHTLIDADVENFEQGKPDPYKGIFTYRPGFVRKIEGKWARPEFQPDFKNYTSPTGFPGPLGLPIKGKDWSDERVLKDTPKSGEVKSADLLRQFAPEKTDGGKNSVIPPSQWYSTYMDKDYTRYGPVCPSKTYHGQQNCRWVMEAELRGHALSQPGIREVDRRQLIQEAGQRTLKERQIVLEKNASTRSGLKIGSREFTPGAAGPHPLPREKTRTSVQPLEGRKTAEGFEMQDLGRQRDPMSQDQKGEARDGRPHIQWRLGEHPRHRSENNTGYLTTGRSQGSSEPAEPASYHAHPSRTSSPPRPAYALQRPPTHHAHAPTRGRPHSPAPPTRPPEEPALSPLPSQSAHTSSSVSSSGSQDSVGLQRRTDYSSLESSVGNLVPSTGENTTNATTVSGPATVATAVNIPMGSLSLSTSHESLSGKTEVGDVSED